MPERYVLHVISYLEDAVVVGGVHKTKGCLHDDVVEAQQKEHFRMSWTKIHHVKISINRGTERINGREP